MSKAQQLTSAKEFAKKIGATMQPLSGDIVRWCKETTEREEYQNILASPLKGLTVETFTVSDGENFLAYIYIMDAADAMRWKTKRSIRMALTKLRTAIRDTKEWRSPK